MRWTRMALLTNGADRGRRSRVVLTPRRWRQVCGSNSAGDGDKQARSPGRARRKPLKPLRGECRVISGVTVVTNARVYYTPRAAAGAPGARHSLRPLISRAEVAGTTRAHCVARTRICVRRHCLRQTRSDCARERSDEAIHSFPAQQNGFLRGACHRARIRATRWLAMTLLGSPWLFEIRICNSLGWSV